MTTKELKDEIYAWMPEKPKNWREGQAVFNYVPVCECFALLVAQCCSFVVYARCRCRQGGGDAYNTTDSISVCRCYTDKLLQCLARIGRCASIDVYQFVCFLLLGLAGSLSVWFPVARWCSRGMDGLSGGIIHRSSTLPLAFCCVLTP